MFDQTIDHLDTYFNGADRRGGIRVPSLAGGSLHGTFDSPVLSIGLEGVGFPFHKHQSNWIGVCGGVGKVWYLWRAAYSGSQSPLTAYRRVSMGELERSELSRRKFFADEGVSFLRCVQKVGEIMFLPSCGRAAGRTCIWHATYNLPSPLNLTVGFGGFGEKGKDGDPPELPSLQQGEEHVHGGEL